MVDGVSSSCATTLTTDSTVNVPSHTITGTYVPSSSPHATSADNDLLTVNPNFTLQITAGGTVSAAVGAADVEAGFVEMLDQTTLEITANGNWKVTASVTNVVFPVLATNAIPTAVEVKNNDTGLYVPGGGVVQTGLIADGSPVAFTVDTRLNVMSIGNAPHGNYDFDVVYTISAN